MSPLAFFYSLTQSHLVHYWNIKCRWNFNYNIGRTTLNKTSTIYKRHIMVCNRRIHCSWTNHLGVTIHNGTRYKVDKARCNLHLRLSISVRVQDKPSHLTLRCSILKESLQMNISSNKWSTLDPFPIGLIDQCVPSTQWPKACTVNWWANQVLLVQGLQGLFRLPNWKFLLWTNCDDDDYHTTYFTTLTYDVTRKHSTPGSIVLTMTKHGKPSIQGQKACRYYSCHNQLVAIGSPFLKFKAKCVATRECILPWEKK